jgi:hypothetical protein
MYVCLNTEEKRFSIFDFVKVFVRIFAVHVFAVKYIVELVNGFVRHFFAVGLIL